MLPADLEPAACLRDARARVSRAPSIVTSGELKAMSLSVTRAIIADL